MNVGPKARRVASQTTADAMPLPNDNTLRNNARHAVGSRGADPRRVGRDSPTQNPYRQL